MGQRPILSLLAPFTGQKQGKNEGFVPQLAKLVQDHRWVDCKVEVS